MADDVDDVVRAGPAVAEQHAAETDGYEVPTFDPGRALVTDTRAWQELLDDEDIARGLPARP